MRIARRRRCGRAAGRTRRRSAPARSRQFERDALAAGLLADPGRRVVGAELLRDESELAGEPHDDVRDHPVGQVARQGALALFDVAQRLPHVSGEGGGVDQDQSREP